MLNLKAFRQCFLWTGLTLSMLLIWVTQSRAEVTFTVGWERPVRFKVVDAETGAAVAKPLLIIKTEKTEEGSNQPVAYYEVLEGSENGMVPFQANEKIRGVEVRAVATGYALLTRNVLWQELPPRQRDEQGLDLGPPPEIVLALKDLSRTGRWQSNFRLTVAPDLDELLQVKPPFLSTEDKRIISEFLNRERNQMLGL
jgi:hypothetical protein